jgi:hypothetical protein
LFIFYSIFIAIICSGLVTDVVMAQQSVIIRRFVPGNYRADNQHQVEIYNPNSSIMDLTNWLLVTRDYSVVFPPRTLIPAGGVLYLRKLKVANSPANTMELDKCGGFLIRLYSRRVEGNYVALFTPTGKIVQAFYHSQLPSVPFLPDSGEALPISGKPVKFYLPAENHYIWRFYGVGDDPAIGFVQQFDQWRVTAADPEAAIDRITAYNQLVFSYDHPLVRLRFRTDFEENLREIQIERSLNQTDFQTIAKLPAAGRGGLGAEYLFLDKQIVPDTVYYYRLSHEVLPGMRAFSRVVEVSTYDRGPDFQLTYRPKASGLYLQFKSLYSERVIIKLLDANYRQVLKLFDGYVYADIAQLLEVTQQLPAKPLQIMAITQRKRYLFPLSLNWIQE